MNEESPNIFSLAFDQDTRTNLLETAKWARFISIVAFIFLCILFIAVIFMATYNASNINAEGDSAFLTGYGIGMALVYILLMLIWFFPVLFLFRFSKKINTAVAGNDQAALNASFHNLKACFRYVGIITLVILAIYALAILFTLITMARL